MLLVKLWIAKKLAVLLAVRAFGVKRLSSFVVDAFQDRIQSHQHALFRKLLKLAADLERAPPGSREGASSSWVLNPEFTDL